MTSLTLDFDESKFHFGKVKKEEILLETNILNVPVTFLINNSPLTKYHTLLCPEISSHKPQILDENAIKISIKLLQSFRDRSFRIGYNSPGALACYLT